MDIPVQVKGGQSSARQCFKCNAAPEAVKIFANCRSNLFDINSWAQLLKLKAGTFTMTDSGGKIVVGPPQKGYLVKIKLAGPGNRRGQGFDWVVIDQVVDLPGEVGLRLKPCTCPVAPNGAIAHFFTAEASNTLQLLRHPGQVEACYFGRNEIPNTGTGSLAGNLRNLLVGKMSIWGFSNIHWSDLLQALPGTTKVYK